MIDLNALVSPKPTAPALKPLTVLPPKPVPQAIVETLQPAEVSKIQTQLSNLQEALETTPMGDVKGHMLVLQHELQSTEYLVDMLQPTDIGLLVKAQRVMMEEDILLNSAPKKAAARKKKTVANLNLTADAFSLPLGLT